MSLCSIRLMPKKEADEFRNTLRREAAEAAKLFRTAQRLLLTFRCAAKMGKMTTVHIRDFVTMCEQCRWTKLVDSDDDDDDDSDNDAAGPSPSTTHHSSDELYVSPQMALAEEHTRLEQERLAAAFSRNKMMEASGRDSNVAALWRERSGVHQQQPQQAKRVDEPASSKFDVKASLGSGIQKRHIRSTVAVHNVLNALSTRENRSLELVKVTRHAAREAFSFCAREGEDDCAMEEFCMMILLVAKHFFPEANEEFGHVYAMDRLWDHSISFFTEEYVTSTVQHVAERLPIATFPGMDLVWGTYGEVCRLAYTLVGGGSPVAEPDILRFARETEVCKWYDHVTIHDVQSAFHFAKDQQLAMRTKARLNNHHSSAQDQLAASMAASVNGGRPGSPLAAAPEGCVDEHGFMDFLAMLGLLAFSIEPKQSQYPTLAAKCEQMIRFLADWYQNRSGHCLEDEVREPARDLPQVVSLDPMSITPTTRHSQNSVVVVGKLFPSRGVFMRFGKRHVTMTTPRDPELGTNLVYPPPLELDRVEILLRVDDEDPTTAECVVRRFKDVRIAVSTDGIIWSPFRGRRFMYERLETPVPVALFLPRMQRVFVHYSSAGGTRPVDGFINVAEWIQFCRDYRFLPQPTVDPDADETQSPAYRAAMSVFAQYSVKAQDRTKPVIAGVKQRLVSALSAHNFARSILNLFVSTGIPVAQGLADSFASDQWIGRQALPDVPEAKLGGHALTVRRAAKGSAMSRRADGVGEKQLNSPRGGRIALVESDVLNGIDPDDAIDIVSFPNGQWANEGELSKLVFRFLTTGDKDCLDNLALRQEALNSMSHRVNVKGLDTLHGGQGAGDGSGGASANGQVSAAKDAVAEARERTRVAVSQAIVVNHRDTLNAVSRRAMDANERHKRQVQRMQQQLADIEQEKQSMEVKLKSAEKNAPHSEDAPLLHHTGDGVLQAEKEALHRVFVYELEKRRALLLAQSAREENLRDVERNRVLKDMKDRLVDSDVSFGRLQDVVIGQADTIERQSDVLRLLKDRATILTADVMYYRAAHTKLLTIVSEDPEKRDLLLSVQQEKALHEVSVESVLTDMRMEAKTDGKKGAAANGNAGIKELVKLQKQKAASRGGAGADPSGPLSAADFLLPKAPKMKVTLSAEEAEERTREAVSSMETQKNTEIEHLNEQLAFLRNRVMELGGDEEDEEDDDGGDYYFDDNGDPHGDDGDGAAGGDGSRRTPSLSRSSRRSRRSRSTPGAADIEVQTDPIDFDDDDDGDEDAHEASLGRSARRHTTSGGGARGFQRFASFFGNSAGAANITLHHVHPEDTFASIAAQYHVPLQAVLLANFIEPPIPSSDDGVLDAEQEMELKLSLMGIASKTIRVPMSEATEGGGVVSPRIGGGTATSWSVLSAGTNSSRGTPIQTQRGAGARTPSVVITPQKGTAGLGSVPASRGSLDSQHNARSTRLGSNTISPRDPEPSIASPLSKTTKPPLATKMSSSGTGRAGIVVSPPDSFLGVGTPVGRDNGTPMAPWSGQQGGNTQHLLHHEETDDEAILAASVSSATAAAAASTSTMRGRQSSNLLTSGAARQGIPGYMEEAPPSSAAVTPRLDPLLMIPDAVAVRQSYSFTPDTQSRRAEKVVKHSEDQLSRATAGISEVIASVTTKVMEAGSAHLLQFVNPASPINNSRVGSGSVDHIPQANVSTTSRSSTGSGHVHPTHDVVSTSSIEREPLDQMTAYVETACTEAKKFQSSFLFQWGGSAMDATGATLSVTGAMADVQGQRFMQPGSTSLKLTKGPVIKPKKAAQRQQQQQQGTPTGPSHLKATTNRGDATPSPTSVSPMIDAAAPSPQQQQQQALLEERLRAVSSPDWLVVVSAPVRELVRKTLETSSHILTQQLPLRSPQDEPIGVGGATDEEDERTAIYRQRLFAKASQHFVEAELLRRLLIVREAQEFFQSCVQRYVLMRSRLERESLQHRIHREEEFALAGTTSDFRAATSDRDALRMEAFHAQQDTDMKNETARRRDLEKNLRASRKLMQTESQVEFAAQNSREKKITQELARIKREAVPVSAALSSMSRGNAAAKVAAVVPARPKFLAPLADTATVDGMRIPTAMPRTPEVVDVPMPSTFTSASRSPKRDDRMVAVDTSTSDAIRNTLAMIIHSPVKLQRLPAASTSPVPTARRGQLSPMTSSSAPISDILHRKLPSAALDQIELVAKAEALLLSKRTAPQQQQQQLR